MKKEKATMHRLGGGWMVLDYDPARNVWLETGPYPYRIARAIVGRENCTRKGCKIESHEHWMDR